MRPRCAQKSGWLCVNMRCCALMTRGALLGNTLASRMRYTASEVKHILQYYDNCLKDSDASEIVIEVL